MMKHLLYLFLLFPVLLSGQELYSFENSTLDGWLQSPASRWEISYINPLKGLASLHHSFDNVSSGTDWISRSLDYPDLSDTLIWTFRIKHTYNPSSGNNWQFFVLANNPVPLMDLPGCSGFFIGVNCSCSDDLLKIWQVINGDVIEICASSVDYQKQIGTNIAPRISVCRFPNGLWELGLDIDGASAINPIGKGNEIRPMNGEFVGCRFSYSSAQDRKLWMDDLIVEGRYYKDTLPPVVEELIVEGEASLVLTFSEPVRKVDSTLFIWNGLEADSITIRGECIELYFHGGFPNRVAQELSISNIADKDANLLKDTIVSFYQNVAEYGDIVINELMIDPEPVIYLPALEYIELFNRYEKSISMEGWTIVANGKDILVDTIELDSEEYLVFTFKSMLTNSGGRVSLFDQLGRLIHTLDYEEMGHYDKSRSDGGWSLERIDPDNLCGGFENWSVSESWRGGTPGEINSTNDIVEDVISPSFLYYGLPDSSSIAIHLNEYIYLEKETPNFALLDGILLETYMLTNPTVGNMVSCFSKEIFVGNQPHSLLIAGLKDCKGNEIEDLEITFKLAERPRQSEIILNEVMFDPVDGSVEYFEIWNVGNAYYDLKDLKYKVGEVDANGGSFNKIIGHSFILRPGSYVAFTSDSRFLRQAWGLDWDVNVVEIEGWRSLPNGSGCITIADRSEQVIDRFCFNDSMHHDYISISKGVALERTYRGTCYDGEQCWTSASSSVNYGTPGRKNSQYQETLIEDDISIYPEVFSPNNDAYQDILQILIPSKYRGGGLDIFVSDINGHFVCDIIRDAYTGNSDAYFWDGQDANGSIVLPGLYVIHISISCENYCRRERKVCAVRYR